MKPVMDKHGVDLWSNLETFDRDMPFRPPTLRQTHNRPHTMSETTL